MQVSIRKFREIKQKNSDIKENSFVEYDEQVEKWWNYVKSHGPEVPPRTNVVQGNFCDIIFDLFFF